MALQPEHVTFNSLGTRCAGDPYRRPPSCWGTAASWSRRRSGRVGAVVVQSPSIRNGWRSPTPLLMIANGGHDPYHALEEAQSAYAKAGEPKRCPTTCSACTPGRARSRLTALSDGLSRRGAPILHYRF